MKKIRIDYYSDLLCVWAYIAEQRVLQLKAEFSDNIDIHWRYLSVFGDIPQKLNAGWSERGGIAGYAEHVHGIVQGFHDIQINEAVWRKDIPYSSTPAHLWLCAARLLPGDHEEKLAHAIRHAFFKQAVDVGNSDNLKNIASHLGIDTEAIQYCINSGEAWAKLSHNLRLASAAQIQASPTLIFNEGRQRLTGNVGYRIIKANLTELLDKPEVQHSWC